MQETCKIGEKIVEWEEREIFHIFKTSFLSKMISLFLSTGWSQKQNKYCFHKAFKKVFFDDLKNNSFKVQLLLIWD
jgi:hypothetical protein